MSNQKYTNLTAYGVTQATAATWAAALTRTPRVLVPVSLQVLMVRPGAAPQFADIGMRVPAPDPGKTISASTMMPDPFSALQSGRTQGAYLLWALPDALTKGDTQDSSGNFPAVPDRWLVMRICPSQKNKGKRTMVGWMLQSGDPTPAKLDLSGWTEPGPPAGIKKPLTALGHGEGAWAAVYDNVQWRLGFYDDLKDCPQGPIAYVVCGWYSDDALDPLGDPSIHSLAAFNAKMDEMQWGFADDGGLKEIANRRVRYQHAVNDIGLKTRLSAMAQARATQPFDARPFVKPVPGSTPAGPPYVTDGDWWPQGTLYHGSVLGIGWPGIGWPGNEQGLLSGEYGGPPSAGKINVAIGSTMSEALAALVAQANNSPSQGRILEAFQLGMLPELDQPDGRARLDALLRASAFASQSDGVDPDRVWQAASGPIPTPPANPPTPGAGVFERYQDAASRQARRPKQQAMPPAQSGQIKPIVLQPPAYIKESNIVAGGLGALLGQVSPPTVEPSVEGAWVDTERARPRYYCPTDPVVLMQGVSRAFVHGNDDLHTKDGKLQCRLSGACLHVYAKWEGDISLPPIYPADVLDNGVDNGSVPPECDEILGEAAILDPGAAATMADAASASVPQFNTLRAKIINHVMTEQTALHALRDPRVDHSAILAHSGFQGTVPAPNAIGLPQTPWSPVYLEWLIEFTPSPSPMQDWQLGETDFNESPPQPAGSPAAKLQFRGRCSVNEGANFTAAMAVRKAVDQITNAGGTAQLPVRGNPQAISALSLELLGQALAMQVSPGNAPDGERSLLEDIASALEKMDVLAASFNTFHLQLRGGYAPDGHAAPQPGDPQPKIFFPIRAGELRVLQLRLVDGFGQFLDLAGSGINQAADPNKLLLSETLQMPGNTGQIALPPRFTAPTRVSLRLLDAAGTGTEATLTTDQAPGISPVCGYIMPNHLDGALEFFGQDGANLGMVRPADDNSIVWEDAPGRPSTVGSSPSLAIPNLFLGQLAGALVRWGIADAGLPSESDNALQAILRVIDSTLWSVDPFGHAGDEHHSLLVGHPVAVLRASLKVELQEPVQPDAVKLYQVPVRIGALTHWQDGVLGYFINDDYTQLYCSDAAAADLARPVGPGQGFLQQANLVADYYAGFASDSAAAAVTHPYVNRSGILWVHPGQVVNLTILVEPLTVIHATSGIVPRKEIGMRREWVTAALAQIAPTFRFGPVLIDPKTVRMPIAADVNGSWSWDHRQDVITWANDPVTHATQDAILSPDPPVGSEGWLRLNPPQPGATQ